MKLRSKTTLLMLWATLGTSVVLAEPGNNQALTDHQALEEKARTGYIDRFLRFMQDKNVMGKARTPDGKVVRGGAKTQFNNDDGMSYKSDLTYHDFSYNTTEETKGPDGKAKTERLFAFVSSHGKDEEAVGSSELERTVFQAHKAATKAEEEGKGEESQPDKGIRFQSIFKITTREVKAPPEPTANNAQLNGAQANGGGGNNNGNNSKNNNKDETIIVDRREIKDDVRTQIAKVGENSFQSIQQSARDDESKNDQNALANGTLLRVAAAQALIGWDQSTAANLAQRRLNKGIRENALPVTPQLSEAISTCEQFSQTVESKISLAKSPDEQKRLREDLERMTGQCKELAGTRFDEVAPRFVRTEDGKGEVLKSAGLADEDGIERDLRVQLQVLRKGGIDANNVPNNWKYEDSEQRARVSVVGDGGEVREEDRTVREQMDTYNNQIFEAKKGYEEVGSRMGSAAKYDPNQMDQYLLTPESQSTADIVQPPQSAMEELGVDAAPGAGVAPADDYQGLLNQVRAD